jgi:HlyD family secretion protein
MKNIMNKNLLSITFLILVISSCGSDDNATQETTFYKKETVNQKKLELSIEASGIIEAISSVEIKSKASGEILLLGAEVGDLVEKGSILGQIDQ